MFLLICRLLYTLGTVMEMEEKYKKFGLDRNELYNSYVSVQKIVWEQVLALSIYARQVYFSDKGNQFHQRAKLIYGVGFLGRDKLKPYVLELVEKGCSSTEIITFLLKLKESAESTINIEASKNVEDELKEDSSVVEKLLRKIKPQLRNEGYTIIANANQILLYLDEKQIAFPSSKNGEYPYSYYAMYKSLNNPFQIFSKMLSVDLSLESMDSLILHIIRNFLKNEKTDFFNLLFSISEYFDNDNLDKVINHIELKNYELNINDLSIYVRSNILKFLSYYFRDVFSYIQDYEYLEINNQDTSLDNIKIQTPLSEISNIRLIDDQLLITFDKNVLQDLIHLGQVDSVMTGVKEKILDKINNPYYSMYNEKNELDINSNSLRNLELWHKKQDQKLIKKVDQIPKLVVSIIEFDIRNQLGFCDRDFGYNVLYPILNYKRVSMQEVYILTTSLIKRCLYEKSGLDSYVSTLNGVSINEFISKYFDNSENSSYSDSEEILGDDIKINFHRNKMMSTWANEDQNSIIERFKKLPPYLKGNKIISISDLIDKQKKVKTNNTYPIDSFFPLPLWVKFLKTDF
jgi:hypothetical protein